MMAVFGLLLLPAVGLGLAATGWPAYAVLLAASGLGAFAVAAAGDASVLGALPARLNGLLESDILQALPLFVLVGALLNRLPLVDTVFRTIVGLAGRHRPAAPRVAALAVAALLAPMCGSVGASVATLSRAVAPRLAAAGTPARDRFATIAAAATLGVVIPPSLVLILLGDALMGAHTLALNMSGRSARVLNTQDVFAAALGPAALFLVLALVIVLLPRRPDGAIASPPAAGRPPPRDILLSAATIGFVILILGGVAAGYLYAVEAAAAGGTALLAGGIASGRLRGPDLAALLADALALTGALFALLAAATTFTLVLRGLGSDRLLLRIIGALPGDPAVSALAVMAILAATAFVLDAFEIIVVVVPLLMPGLLMRVEDAHWVAALTLLTLQLSFLLPPLGYAFVMSRAMVAPDVPVGRLLLSLAPFIAAAFAVVVATFVYPQLAHLGARAERTSPSLTTQDVLDQFNRLAPTDAAPPLGFGD